MTECNQQRSELDNLSIQEAQVLIKTKAKQMEEAKLRQSAGIDKPKKQGKIFESQYDAEMDFLKTQMSDEEISQLKLRWLK